MTAYNFSTICATIDSECKKLICGLSNSEIRMWGIEGNIMDEQTNVNSNISRVSLACNLEQDEEPVEEVDLYVLYKMHVNKCVIISVNYNT